MLDEGLKMSLEPSHLARHERNRKRAEAEGKKIRNVRHNISLLNSAIHTLRVHVSWLTPYEC